MADLFKSGLVWARLGLRWVEQVRDEMAAFPHSENDDLHDCRGLRSATHPPGRADAAFDGPRSEVSAAAADGILLRQVGIRRFGDRYALTRLHRARERVEKATGQPYQGLPLLPPANNGHPWTLGDCPP